MVQVYFLKVCTFKLYFVLLFHNHIPAFVCSFKLWCSEDNLCCSAGPNKPASPLVLPLPEASKHFALPT
jgi:hypothetical protein